MSAAQHIVSHGAHIVAESDAAEKLGDAAADFMAEVGAEAVAVMAPVVVAAAPVALAIAVGGLVGAGIGYALDQQERSLGQVFKVKKSPQDLPKRRSEANVLTLENWH
jgi:hypothetical protein